MWKLVFDSLELKNLFFIWVEIDCFVFLLCICIVLIEEYFRLERVFKLSRSILVYVNQVVKDCENRNKLRIL